MSKPPVIGHWPLGIGTWSVIYPSALVTCRSPPPCRSPGWSGRPVRGRPRRDRHRPDQRRPLAKGQEGAAQGGGRRAAQAEAAAEAAGPAAEQAAARVRQGRADRPGRQLDRRADEPVRPLRDAAPHRGSRTRNWSSATSPARGRGGHPPAVRRLHEARRPALRLQPGHVPLLLRLQRVVRRAGRGRASSRRTTRSSSTSTPPSTRATTPKAKPRFVLVSPIAFEPTGDPLLPDGTKREREPEAVRRTP